MKQIANMNVNRFTSLVTSLLFLLVATGCNRSSLMVTDLRTEYLTEPVNMDIQSPGLSWKLDPAASGLQNLKQHGWQILVASSQKLLKRNEGDLWDSGIQDSSDLTRVIYAGKRLNSRQLCYWKVRVWDQDEKPSSWSPVASWRMALLSKNDWSGASWIGLEKDSVREALCSRPFQNFTMKEPVMKTSYPSPLFRKQFKVTAKVSRAMAYISGLGYSELYVNGQRAGDNVLDPGQTNYDVFSLYVTHDITSLLKKGENVIGVMLGNGFYGQNIGFADWLEYGSPRMKCKIWIEYKNGTADTLVSGTDWKATAGPVLFNNVYGGESYDARLDKDGWNKPGYEDSSWKQALVVSAPTDSLRSQLIPPIKKMKTITPVRIFEATGGRWIVDLGQNIAGWARISVREKAGRQIIMRFAENLDSAGRELDFASLGHQHTGMIQTNIYVCKGNGVENWEPRFTYAGFRYIEITGLTQKPDTATIHGVLVRTSVARTGHFACADSMLNKIYENSLWTIEDNLHSITEDCPAREKCGWLGDAHGTAETDLFNYDMALFYTKYMGDIESQLGRGGETYLGEPATPGIPANISTGRRVCQEARVDWGVAVVLIPYYLYLYDSDIRVFKRFYPHMKDFINYGIRYEDKNGIIQNGYGDWCPPGGNEKMECPPVLTSTAFFYGSLNILRHMAGLMGDTAYATWCEKKMVNVKDNFNKAFLKQIPGTDYLTYGSQTGIVMAFRMGLIPPLKMKQVSDGLVYDIRTLHQGHISTGIHGQRIYSVLCDMGYDSLAYSIFTTPTFPSLGYAVSSGQTTWPEEPHPWKDKSVKRTCSFNHPMNSGFAAFFHEAVGGIRPLDPGFRHFQIKPYLYNQLQWANTDMETPYGKIVSHWRTENNTFILDISVPCNTTATVYLPSADGRSTREVGSGNYHFVSKF
jgi:alpha-L-rhamnosidase